MNSKELNLILESFVKLVKNTNNVCLLQAFDGMFAMVEDAKGQEYLPVWSDESTAGSHIVDDWKDYSIEIMPLKEFVNWLSELQEDEIMIVIYLKDENLITMKPSELKKILKI